MATDDRARPPLDGMRADIEQAKEHYDLQLARYLDMARIDAGRNPLVAWADLAVTLPDDVAGRGGLDYALGVLTSALRTIVEREQGR